MLKYMLALAVAFSMAGQAQAEDVSIRTIKAYSTKLTQSPTGALAAFLVGTPQKTGLYAISAFYPAGAKGRPHTHPDERVLTVISGTFYAGSGPDFDETKVEALPPGSVLVIPANALHWGWAKDGDVLLQEVGVGPTSNQFPDSAGK